MGVQWRIDLQTQNYPGLFLLFEIVANAINPKQLTTIQPTVLHEISSKRAKIIAIDITTEQILDIVIPLNSMVPNTVWLSLNPSHNDTADYRRLQTRSPPQRSHFMSICLEILRSVPKSASSMLNHQENNFGI